MRTLTISMCVLEQDGSYLLQKRSSDVMKGAAGLTGAFGGQIEPNESRQAACSREISEETSLQIDPEAFTYLGEITTISDRDSRAVNIIAHVFYYEVESEINVTALEGEIVRVKKSKVLDVSNMSPATKMCFKELVKE